jgi:hypothetical protein
MAAAFQRAPSQAHQSQLGVLPHRRRTPLRKVSSRSSLRLFRPSYHRQLSLYLSPPSRVFATHRSGEASGSSTTVTQHRDRHVKGRLPRPPALTHFDRKGHTPSPGCAKVKRSRARAQHRVHPLPETSSAATLRARVNPTEVPPHRSVSPL